MNIELAAIAASQGGVFTAEQAATCGITRAMLRGAFRRKEVRPLRQGVYSWSDEWQTASPAVLHLMDVAAAVLLRKGFDTDIPRVVGGGWSAGFVHQLPVRPRSSWRDPNEPSSAVPGKIALEPLQWKYAVPSHVDLISADRGRRTFRLGVDTRPAELPPSHITYVRGVPLTSMARTTTDLMRASKRHDALIVADAALAVGLAKQELQDMAEFCGRWPYGTQAIWAADFANGLSESPAESLARLVLEDLGIVGAEQQVKLFDSCGRLIARVDFLFRRRRVVLEVDGQIKYLDPWCGSAEEARRWERERQERLEAAGWIVIRTTWRELLSAPGALQARLLRAFALADAAS